MVLGDQRTGDAAGGQGPWEVGQGVRHSESATATRGVGCDTRPHIHHRSATQAPPTPGERQCRSIVVARDRSGWGWGGRVGVGPMLPSAPCPNILRSREPLPLPTPPFTHLPSPPGPDCHRRVHANNGRATWHRWAVSPVVADAHTPTDTSQDSARSSTGENTVNASTRCQWLVAGAWHTRTVQGLQLVPRKCCGRP